MVLEFFFQQTTCYVEEKREENSTYTANVPTFTKRRQAAKNSGYIMPRLFKMWIMLSTLRTTGLNITVDNIYCTFQGFGMNLLNSVLNTGSRKLEPADG